MEFTIHSSPMHIRNPSTSLPEIVNNICESARKNSKHFRVCVCVFQSFLRQAYECFCHHQLRVGLKLLVFLAKLLRWVMPPRCRWQNMACISHGHCKPASTCSPVEKQSECPYLGRQKLTYWVRCKSAAECLQSNSSHDMKARDITQARHHHPHCKAKHRLRQTKLLASLQPARRCWQTSGQRPHLLSP